MTSVHFKEMLGKTVQNIHLVQSITMTQLMVDAGHLDTLAVVETLIITTVIGNVIDNAVISSTLNRL